MFIGANQFSQGMPPLDIGGTRMISGPSFGLDETVQILILHWYNQWFGFFQKLLPAQSKSESLIVAMDDSNLDCPAQSKIKDIEIFIEKTSCRVAPTTLLNFFIS